MTGPRVTARPPVTSAHMRTGLGTGEVGATFALIARILSGIRHNASAIPYMGALVNRPGVTTESSEATKGFEGRFNICASKLLL